MQWPQLSSLGASLHKFTSRENDRGLILLVGHVHSINIDEAVKFGFAEASETQRSKIISGLDGAYDGEKVMVSDTPSIRLSQLIKFAPGFNRTMIEDVPTFPVPDGSETIPVPAVAPQEDEVSPASPIVAMAAAGAIDTSPPAPAASAPLRQPKKIKTVISDAGVKIGRARKDFYSRRVLVEDVYDMTEAEKKKFISKLVLWPYSPSQAREDGVEHGVAEFIQSARVNMPDFSALKSGSISSTKEEVSFIEFCNLISSKLNSNLRTKEDLALALIDLHENPSFMAYVKYIEYSGYYTTREHKKATTFCNYISDFKPSKKPDGAFYIYRFSDCLKVIENPQTEREINDNEYALRSNRYHWDKLCRVRKEKTKDEDGKPVRPDRPHLAGLKNSWLKNGVDITSQDMIDVFGFRGVEFGEWLPQDERQIVLNEAYAACRALAEVTGLPERMMSLDGTLAIAFGSRGKGRAMAHYEPDLKVFNLTRMNGAGSMAHEWAHALDYFLSQKQQSLIESAFSGNPKTDQEIEVMEGKARDLFAGSGDERARLAIFNAAMQIVKAEIELSMQPETAMDELQSSIGLRVNYAISWIVKWESGTEGFNDLMRVLRGELMDIYGVEAEDGDIPAIGNGDLKSFGFTAEGRSRISIADRTADLSYGMDNRAMPRIIDALRATGFVDDSKLHKKNNEKNFKHLIRGAISDMGNFRRFILKPESLLATSFRKSDFLANAELLDTGKSKKYYSTGKELFARAFESYVFDKMNAMDMPCDYLVHSVEESRFSDKKKYIGSPYPSGDERKKINIAMSRLTGYVREYAQPKPAPERNIPCL